MSEEYINLHWIVDFGISSEEVTAFDSEGFHDCFVFQIEVDKEDLDSEDRFMQWAVDRETLLALKDLLDYKLMEKESN